MTTGYAESFKEIRVYQKARDVSGAVFRLSATCPREEMDSLSDQIRRSAPSIGAQIAEAWGKRRYEKHFVSKLTDAAAEQMETEHCVSEALGCAYLSAAAATQLNSDLEAIGRRLDSMMQKSASLCRPADSVVRDEVAEYFVARLGER